ncbi:DUF2490 domain-containing protein [Pontibacter locisalis]|uniref:DUF2490 domain-containing protein n=1 Tax=Pontibacter locisalis TaxID=1719035 RepID=A0ABW5IPR4_9BACT
MHVHYTLLFTWLFLSVIAFQKVQAQKKEIREEHAVWEAAFGNFRVSEHQSVYVDLHHIKGSFTVARIGLTQHLSHNISATGGYSFAWLTVPGADSDALKRHEHRPWLQVVAPARLTQNLNLSTRFRYDMRYKQRVENATLQSAYDFSQRLRLQEILRLNLPSLKTGESMPYLALSNEVMLNVGRNVTHNLFDQNRLGLMAGLEWPKIRLQAGYINRFVQSASVPNRYTSNHNYTIWLFYSLDLRKQQE